MILADTSPWFSSKYKCKRIWKVEIYYTTNTQQKTANVKGAFINISDSAIFKLLIFSFQQTKILIQTLENRCPENAEIVKQKIGDEMIY